MTLGLDLKRVALKHRRTRIVATVGPASAGVDVLGRLVHAGVDVFRLNFSHGTHDAHAAAFANIRAVAAHAGRHIAVLADLCGPKIRVGRFEGGGITLAPGEEIVVTVRPGILGAPGLVPSEYLALADDVKAGDRVLLADGKLELSVAGVSGPDIRCLVIHGGHLGDRKGMNLPGVAVSAPALTDKDRADALFAAELGVDYLALSFVRAAADIEGLKSLLAAHGRNVPVIAKIEKPEALDAIQAIVLASDGIMVARGDLGVELPAEEVPIIQQELVRVARALARPVIVATQMLESMIDNPRPTRAEVSDVAAAALGSADAVMLSAETASGRFPVESVATLDRVLRLVEGYQWAHGQFGRVDDDEAQDEGHAFARAVAQLSRDLGVRAVIVPTRSGRTARTVASQRPAAPIVALADHDAMCRRLGLLWGVRAEAMSSDALGHLPATARATAVRLGLAVPGQHVLLVWDAEPSQGASAPTITVLRA